MSKTGYQARITGLYEINVLPTGDRWALLIRLVSNNLWVVLNGSGDWALLFDKVEEAKAEAEKIVEPDIKPETLKWRIIEAGKTDGK